jgi:rare lipoprotein A
MKKIFYLGFLSFILVGCSTVQTNNNYKNDITTKAQIKTTDIKGVPSQYNCEFKPSKNSGAFYKTDGPLELPENLNLALEPIPMLEPLHKWANRPYNKLGQDFYPITEPGFLIEEGIGSWYGRRYHGEKTSNGEIYDMFQMTAASPILPIPSYARVTNLQNGRAVTVRINDRGPFLKGRIIDLSFLAACRLGYVNTGSTKVRVESLIP